MKCSCVRIRLYYTRKHSNSNTGVKRKSLFGTSKRRNQMAPNDEFIEFSINKKTTISSNSRIFKCSIFILRNYIQRAIWHVKMTNECAINLTTPIQIWPIWRAYFVRWIRHFDDDHCYYWRFSTLRDQIDKNGRNYVMQKRKFQCI